MSGILDGSLVALALITAVAYAVATLGPKGLRRRMRTGLAQLAAHAPEGLHLGRIARRLEAAAADPSAGACGGCGGACSQTAGGVKDGVPEVRVPLDTIGKRN
jgi:hypothetical protein